MRSDCSVHVKRRRRVVAAATIAPLVALVAACGSSSSSTSATTTTGSSGSIAAPAKLTGVPIKVGEIGEIKGAFLDWPFQAAADKAAAAGINSRGGINGRPIQMITCDGQNNPNDELQCARNLVSDGVVADIGGITVFNTPAVDAEFLQNNVAQIAVNPIYPADFTNSNQFLINNSDLTLPIGSILAAKEAGLKKVFYIAAASSASSNAYKFAKDTAQAQGIDLGVAYFPLTATTFTSYVQSAISFGAQAIFVGNSDAENSGILLALRQSGAKMKMIGLDTGPPTGIVAACGSGGGVCTGALGVGATLPPTYTANAGVRLFQQDMAAEVARGDSAASPSSAYNAFGLVGWLGMQAFADVVKTLPTVTAATVLAGFQQAKNIPLWGIIPNWTPNKSAGIPGFPRISNPYLYLTIMHSDLNTYALSPTPYNMLTVDPKLIP